jgi:hypothetical protein
MHEEGRSHSLPRRVQQSGILGRPGDVRAIRQAALHVGAVIAGYRPDLLEVKSADDAVSGLVAVNSEIVVAYSIDHAVAAVEGRPAEIPPPPEGDKPQPVP